MWTGACTFVKRALASVTNLERRSGAVADVIEGADLLIGVSGARVLPASALARMNSDPIVFALANPDPEVSPEEAFQHVRILATGRSDYPNQINNVLCFPGIFRGALDVRATRITESMKTAAAARDRRDRRGRGAARGLHHPLGVQPRSGPGRGRCGGRRGAGDRDGPGRRRPGVRLDRGVRGSAGSVGRRSRGAGGALPGGRRRGACRRGMRNARNCPCPRCRGRRRRFRASCTVGAGRRGTSRGGGAAPRPARSPRSPGGAASTTSSSVANPLRPPPPAAQALSDKSRRTISRCDQRTLLCGTSARAPAGFASYAPRRPRRELAARADQPERGHGAVVVECAAPPRPAPPV